METFGGFFIELELSKKNKWLFSYCYNPHKGKTKGLDELNSKYDNILIIGDLSTETNEFSLNKFLKPISQKVLQTNQLVSKMLRNLHALT